MTQPNLKLKIEPVDIETAECGNRAQCVVAHALDRQLKLGGLGYIRVDANHVGYTQDQKRFTWHVPNSVATYLRRFDELGGQFGVEYAREHVKPAVFILPLVRTRAAVRPATIEEKARINELRNRRAATIREAGGKVSPPRKRYAGV